MIKKTHTKNSSPKRKVSGMVFVQDKIISKKLKNELLLEKYNLSEQNLKMSDKHGRYILSRTFSDYNHIYRNILLSPHFEFTSIFKREIISTLSAYEKKYKKKELNVLDDGAGRGTFLKELKDKWNFLKEKKLASAELKTTAVSLTNTFAAETKDIIDHKHVGNVLNFLPEKKYDFIFSVYGGFFYTLPTLQKEVLLKYLYSLNKGGLAIFSINPIQLNLKNNSQISEIIRALEKRGFRASLTSIPEKFAIDCSSCPRFFLFVERS